MHIATVSIIAVLSLLSLTGLMLLVFLLNKHPLKILAMNQVRRKLGHGWVSKLDVLLLFVGGAAIIYGAYSVSFLLLGWMPEDWGSFDHEINEWVTFRHSLSLVFGLWIGLFLINGIGEGIRARVSLDNYVFESMLKKQIRQTQEVTGMKDLKEKYQRLINTPLHQLPFEETYWITQVLSEKQINLEQVHDLLRDGIQILNQEIRDAERWQ